MGPRDLHRILHRLGAGGDEDRLLRGVARHQLVELLRQAHGHVIGGHHHAGVAELLELCGHRSLHLQMSVARIDDRDPGAEIDVAIAFDVPQLGVARALDVDR